MQRNGVATRHLGNAMCFVRWQSHCHRDIANAHVQENFRAHVLHESEAGVDFLRIALGARMKMDVLRTYAEQDVAIGLSFQPRLVAGGQDQAACAVLDLELATVLNLLGLNQVLFG